MNRKQRRIAAKLGQQAAPPASRNATRGSSGEIPDLLARGRLHHRAGQLAEAELCYKNALALDPNHFDGLHFFGILAQQTGRSALAAHLIGKAIALRDQSPALQGIGTPERSKLAAAHSNLSIVWTALGDFPAALNAIQRSLQLAETENAKLLFVGCLRNLTVIPDGTDVRDDLVRAMSEPWGRATDLAPVAANLVKRNGAIAACIGRISATWPGIPAPRELLSPIEFAEICRDRLLSCFLKTTIVADLELERFLTAIRRTILAAAGGDVGAQAFEQGNLRFCFALAQQCFINEYVFSWTEEEKQEAERLRERLVETLASGALIPELWLVAVAAYYPLASLPQADLLMKGRWSAFAAELITLQVQEVYEERQLRASVPRLTAIDDGVSLAVREQYEENPYPRWIKASPAGQTTIEAHLRQLFPLGNLPNVVQTPGAEILVAGCGTGQDPIETARLFPAARVLAIDLSLSSICYAIRKTRELGLKNIEYAQADILKLQPIGRTFDVIDTSGVLHHLEQPLVGWRVLLSLLRPGGFMRIGLYSKLARRDIATARTLIADRGYSTSAEDIRRCRQEIAGFGDHAPPEVTHRLDFFSTSRFCDMLFPVQEYQFALPEIADFLNQNQLNFLGFDLRGGGPQMFRQRFASPGALTDLALWHIFETENPSLFPGMYEFWIRKPH